MIQSAIERGLDGIVFTDHGKFVPKKRLTELRKKYPKICLWSGIEITTCEWCDFVVIGLRDKCLEYDIPQSVHDLKWTADELIKYVRKKGGWIHLCHPSFQNGLMPPAMMERRAPYAIEMRSNTIPEHQMHDIQDMALIWGCRLVAVSDAHDVNGLGRYAVRLNGRVRTERQLINKLLRNEYTLKLGEENEGIS